MANYVFSFLIMAFYMMFGLSSSSSINQEHQSLLHSGWWNDHPNISNHCYWDGISCNEARSVTEIVRGPLRIPSSKELLWIQDLNITAFPNLLILYLSGMGLRGTIPTKITRLTNLTSLLV
ncbi:hypothetical protein V8G54_009750 [Vigna mungo]|uniref:Leucine-rich repeat-containing N-terminal plant-type domain-containing protein n=1 Tax=Vigna mungo TaxID=3915 RepID=A0AAQ3NWC2_VIGMU